MPEVAIAHVNIPRLGKVMFHVVEGNAEIPALIGGDFWKKFERVEVDNG